MGADTDLLKKPAPTFFGIIIFKLLKGSIFLALAIFLYCESDNDLPQDFKDFLAQPTVQYFLNALRVHPGNKFFTHLAEQIAQLTEANVLTAAVGTLCYSLFSLVEGTGMIFRVSWAGWMAIGESAFFIPIEMYELGRPGKFSWFLVCVMFINVIIVWYLYKNRHRLFRHHHRHSEASEAAGRMLQK
jgi:uncharacterized membrane protein (DUF2068 family)